MDLSPLGKGKGGQQGALKGKGDKTGEAKGVLLLRQARPQEERVQELLGSIEAESGAT